MAQRVPFSTFSSNSGCDPTFPRVKRGVVDMSLTAWSVPAFLLLLILAHELYARKNKPLSHAQTREQSFGLPDLV